MNTWDDIPGSVMSDLQPGEFVDGFVLATLHHSSSLKG